MKKKHVFVFTGQSQVWLNIWHLTNETFETLLAAHWEAATGETTHRKRCVMWKKQQPMEEYHDDEVGFTTLRGQLQNNVSQQGICEFDHLHKHKQWSDPCWRPHRSSWHHRLCQLLYFVTMWRSRAASGTSALLTVQLAQDEFQVLIRTFQTLVLRVKHKNHTS